MPFPAGLVKVWVVLLTVIVLAISVEYAVYRLQIEQDASFSSWATADTAAPLAAGTHLLLLLLLGLHFNGLVSSALHEALTHQGVCCRHSSVLAPARRLLGRAGGPLHKDAKDYIHQF